MRVFVTGGSGHIGSATIVELLGAGHEVVALARSEGSAAALRDLGAQVRRGDLAETDGLREAAADADAVIHLAFRHDAMRDGDFDGAVATDAAVIDAFGEALAGTDKVLVGAAGMLELAGLGRTGTEEDDSTSTGGRAAISEKVLGLAEHGVRASVVRLPPVVHSDQDRHGFIPTLIASARAAGRSAYVGDGDNRWPAGHTRDVANLYRLAVEEAPAGARLHAVGDEGVPFRRIAEAIGEHLGVPVVTIAAEQAQEHFGWLAPITALDASASSERTQNSLGWAPANPGLIEDLGQGHYFSTETPVR